MLMLEYFDQTYIPEYIDENNPLDSVLMKDPEGLHELYGKPKKIRDYMNFGVKDRTGLSIIEWTELNHADSEFIIEECKRAILKEETQTNQMMDKVDKLEKSMVPAFQGVGKQ